MNEENKTMIEFPVSCEKYAENSIEKDRFEQKTPWNDTDGEEERQEKGVGA